MKEFYLFNKDLEYKKFNERIIPTKYEIVGIRVPILKRFLDKIKNSKKEFIIRYYIGNLMKYYLDSSFDIVKTYENTKFYYVDMMVAWYYQNYYFKVDKETINKHLEEINNNIKKYTIRKIKDSIREKK